MFWTNYIHLYRIQPHYLEQPIKATSFLYPKSGRNSEFYINHIHSAQFVC